MSDRVKSERKAFLRIDEDPFDEAADRVALAKNIPTLTMPLAEEASRPQASSAVRMAQAAPKARIQERTREFPSDAPEASELDFFRVRCPGYLTEQLEARRAELRAQGRKVTISYLVMKALRNDGYRIKDEDFVEDGRRLR